MSNSHSPNICLTVLHAVEDLMSEHEINKNKVIRTFNGEKAISTELELTYKRGMVNRFSKPCKENLTAVEWFLQMAEHLGTRVGAAHPTVSINWKAVDAIENELDAENIRDLFSYDNRISHINYKIKLIKTTNAPSKKPENTIVCFDIILERLYQIGGHATANGKYVFRMNFSNSRHDFYAKIDPAYQVEKVEEVLPAEIPQEQPAENESCQLQTP